MGLVNIILGVIAAFLIATGLSKDPALEKDSKGNVTINAPHEIVRPKIDFTLLKSQAKKLLETPYEEVKPHSSKELASLPYDRYKNIRFLSEKSLWRKEGSAFQIQFMPPGHLYNSAVTINELIEDTYQRIPFLEDYFDWTEVGRISLSPEIGHTGFKVHYPINTVEHTDEFIVFQGSSYFRVVSKGQFYGLSSRALAINTGMPHASEEFPIFKEFWIKKPDLSDSKIFIYGLLDGHSVTGAYEFEITPGEVTKTVINAEIYLRKPVEKFGISPLTSMFFYGENSQIPAGQAYPEIHDSDGLQFQDESGGLHWRPLDNPKKPNIHEFELNNPVGFGLIQRDREFSNYEDANMKYHLRPSAWIEPNEAFGKGNLQLFRFPTKLDSDDNVTMIWVPDAKPVVGEPYRLSYTIFWNSSPPKNLGYVYATRIILNKEGERQFLVDFKGDRVQSYSDENLPTPVIESTNEVIVSDIFIQKIPESEKMRVSFNIPSKLPIKSSELKLYLKDKDQIISETWIFAPDNGN